MYSAVFTTALAALASSVVALPRSSELVERANAPWVATLQGSSLHVKGGASSYDDFDVVCPPSGTPDARGFWPCTGAVEYGIVEVKVTKPNEATTTWTVAHAFNEITHGAAARYEGSLEVVAGDGATSFLISNDWVYP